ncbi:Copper chaperone SCO1/SenC [Burkholderiaceae bacterium]
MRKLFTCGLLILLVACSQASFKNVDITGSKSFGNNFALLDPQGNEKTIADYRGKAVVLFFGYTHCPDVCPSTLIEMQAVMKDLGPLADRVQVIFITVDPERDTAELMAQYPPAFDRRFIGLRPTNEAALIKIAKDFRVYYNKVPGSNPKNYTIDHTAGSYVFDPAGNLRLYIKHGQGAEPIAHDLKILLR